MNVVLVIPTGIGAEIGGHAGDGNPVAKLLASACDTLITHPNVLNASDINEMTENTLYVEGSFLDRFLSGEIELKRVRQNKVLVAVNAPAHNETINAVSAARATIGLDASIIELETPVVMLAEMVDGRATGQVAGWRELCAQVAHLDFDALALVTPITVAEQVAREYLQHGGVNPWGGVEAKVSKLVSAVLNKPVAHAPFGDTLANFNEVVDPRLAAEMVSVTYLHSVLKGLHKAPRIGKGLSVADVDVLVSPGDCYGPPHRYCAENNIPIIFVEDNTTIYQGRGWPAHVKFTADSNVYFVGGYLEAAGLITAMRAGIHWQAISRPLLPTEVRRAKDAG